MPEPPPQGVPRQAGCFDTLGVYVSFSAKKRLALALLMARVLTDNHDAAVATDNLALIADFLNAWLYLHDVP